MASAAKDRGLVGWHKPIGTEMREHLLLLFCLLGLVLTAAITLVIAPGTVTWALSLMID